MGRNMDHVEHPEAYMRATERRIKANARKGRGARWLTEDPTRAAVAEFLGRQYGDGFLAKMATSLEEWGSLTEKQEAAVRKIMDDRATQAAARAAADAASTHQHAVGERLEIDGLEVIVIGGFEGGFGYVNVYTMRRAGNLYVHKGAELGQWLDKAGNAPPRGKAMIATEFDAVYTWRKVQKGDVLTLRATVKKHGEYKGAQQTQLSRPIVQEVRS